MLTAPQWQACGRTECGPVRKHNEDALALLGPQGPWVVADGMGGHAHGEVASQAVIEALQPPLQGDASNHMAQLQLRLQQANDRLFRFAHEHGVSRVGTTVVLALALDWRLRVLWAGDSRLYRLRANELQLLTQDHSMVGELLRRGQITAAQADAHPYGHIITRAVGSEPALQLDELDLDVKPGDRYLLCSDGLSNALGHADIQRIWAATDSAEAAVAELMEAALACAKDNLSVLVMQPLAASG